MSPTEVALLFMAVGALFVLRALSGSVLGRLPLSTAIAYLEFGFALGPRGLGIVEFHILTDAKTLGHLTEIAVIVSFFSAGLKLHVPLHDALSRARL